MVAMESQWYTKMRIADGCSEITVTYKTHMQNCTLQIPSLKITVAHYLCWPRTHRTKDFDRKHAGKAG